jgi:hypothetical protein
VSNIITDFLLTGIITQTDRARYYSFYCWVLWHIEKEERLNYYQDFVENFRRREAAFALSTLFHNIENSPVGVTAAKDRVNNSSGKHIDCNFRVLPASPLGGYGQYYAGSIYQLGLTERSNDGIDRVASGKPKEIAETFHKSIKKIPYIQNRLFSDDNVPIEALKKGGERFSLDSIRKNFASDERKQLIDLFFGYSLKTLDDRSMLRRQTLGLTLHIIYEYEKHGIPVPVKKVDSYIVFPPYYYGELQAEAASAIQYRAPKPFILCQSLWRQFCLQQFLTQAIEGVMYCVLETAGSEPAGIQLAEMTDRLTQREFYLELKEITEKECIRPVDLLSSFNLLEVPNKDKSLEVVSTLSLKNSKSEINLLDKKLDSISKNTAKYISLLIIIYAKWRGLTDDLGFSFVSNHAGRELWTGSVLGEIDGWFDPSFTWENALSIFINNFILDSHDRVLYEKKRLDSCWLHRQENRIHKDQDYGPRWRSSRHMNVVSILKDLNLLLVNESNSISITKEGESVLNTLMS